MNNKVVLWSNNSNQGQMSSITGGNFTEGCFSSIGYDLSNAEISKIGYYRFSIIGYLSSDVVAFMYAKIVSVIPL